MGPHATALLPLYHAVGMWQSSRLGHWWEMGMVVGVIWEGAESSVMSNGMGWNGVGFLGGGLSIAVSTYVDLGVLQAPR